MYAYSVVHVLRYLKQKTEAKNDFVMSSYKHSFGCAIFWAFFYGNMWTFFPYFQGHICSLLHSPKADFLKLSVYEILREYYTRLS